VHVHCTDTGQYHDTYTAVDALPLYIAQPLSSPTSADPADPAAAAAAAVHVHGLSTTQQMLRAVPAASSVRHPMPASLPMPPAQDTAKAAMGWVDCVFCCLTCLTPCFGRQLPFCSTARVAHLPHLSSSSGAATQLRRMCCVSCCHVYLFTILNSTAALIYQVL
jgi:hypothetical protein